MASHSAAAQEASSILAKYFLSSFFWNSGAGLTVFICFLLLLYYSITLLLHYSITQLLYHCTTLPLYYSTTLLLYHSTTPLLYYSITRLLYLPSSCASASVWLSKQRSVAITWSIALTTVALSDLNSFVIMTNVIMTFTRIYCKQTSVYHQNVNKVIVKESVNPHSSRMRAAVQSCVNSCQLWEHVRNEW